MQWRQHEHGRLHQEAQLLSTEQATGQHCCSAECPADEHQEEEEAAAHKVLEVLSCIMTCFNRAIAQAVRNNQMHKHMLLWIIAYI